MTSYIQTCTPIDREQYYMNCYTGSVDNIDGWWYRTDDGELVNAVDLQEVVPVHWDYETNCWETDTDYSWHSC